MKYFNGFALKGEASFFEEQLLSNEFCVAGFSYGAQQAFEYVYNTKSRVDRLILLSPAFFQNHKKSFIRTQLRYYKVDESAYTQEFLKNVVFPSSINLDDYLKGGTAEELSALLSYQWEKEKILELLARGVIIEIFMGEDDKIVDTEKSFEFFSLLCPIYLIKGVGHLLR